MTENGKTTTYSYNGLNQLVSKTASGKTTKYSYDARGNQILEDGPSTDTAFSYFVTGELEQVKRGSTVLQTNSYNHEGTRISKKEGNSTRRYYYDDGQVSYTKDGSSISSANLLSPYSGVSSTQRGSNNYTYLKDIQGSTGSLTDVNGTAEAVYSYSDFGEVDTVVTPDIDNEICYTGAVYDGTTGLHYLNARYYDPANGRFISQDSYRGELDDAGQWHLYVYCANNPVNYGDPSGNLKVPFGYYDVKQRYYAFSQNSFQQYLGYYDIYDYFANLFGFNIGWFKQKTAKWKLQFWKGQYGKAYGGMLNNGCEIGLYYKSGVLWKCANNKGRMLRMKMSLYTKGKSSPLFTRDSKGTSEYGRVWWLTGFRPGVLMPGGKTVPPKKLKMEATIWFDSCNSKYHDEMKALSNRFASGTSYSTNWGVFRVHKSDTWKKKKITWDYGS